MGDEDRPVTTIESPNGTAREPYYLPIGDEVEVFTAAYEARLPVLLKGPTGCGKTRFVEYMAVAAPPARATACRALVTVACHEDLTGSDLVGRYLIEGDETVWIDGPLTRAVRGGAICYLDEVVEARKDTTVLIHPLTDHRRILPIDKTGEILEAHPDFLLVISYNPGYQSALKDLKHSTRQRFVSHRVRLPAARQGGADHRARERRRRGAAPSGSRSSARRSATCASTGSRGRQHAPAGLRRHSSSRRHRRRGAPATPPSCRALTDDAEVQRAVSDIVDVLLP